MRTDLTVWGVSVKPSPRGLTVGKPGQFGLRLLLDLKPYLALGAGDTVESDGNTVEGGT